MCECRPLWERELRYGFRSPEQKTFEWWRFVYSVRQLSEELEVSASVESSHIPHDEPLYPIGIASKLVGVCSATLRIWERKGLVSPGRLGKNRYYTDAEIVRLKHVRSLLHDKGLNLAGVKDIIDHSFCWEIKDCEIDERRKCSVYREYVNRIESES